MYESIAVVGATGAVGRIILKLLEERGFPFKRIKFLASGRSAGKPITFKGGEHTIEELVPDAFEGVDIAIGSTPDEVARDFAPWAVERGAIVVDGRRGRHPDLGAHRRVRRGGARHRRQAIRRWRRRRHVWKRRRLAWWRRRRRPVRHGRGWSLSDRHA